VAGKRLLCIAVGLVSLFGLFNAAPSASAATPVCTVIEIADHTCAVTGDINGGGVTLSGHAGSPGTPGATGSARSPESGKPSAKPAPKPAPKPTPTPGVCPPGTLPEVCETFTVIPAGAPGNPAVTIDDLKNFTPVPGTDHMEPNGWMIVGLSTNFYSVVGSEIQNGILLGQPASVRFTPISWQWTYGDGTSAALSTPGAVWAAQGIAEFDPTPTSHVYTAAGTYFIDLSIVFSADYRYAGGAWTHVFGTITLPANRLEATAGGAKTVLVNRDCTQNPTGPGC
jgi:hypothetical protein